MRTSEQRRVNVADQSDTEISPPKVNWTPSGRRKATPEFQAKPRHLEWPKTGQHAMVDLWVYVAAQIAQTKDHFRVLLAIDKSIRRETGTTPDGNEVLSRWAGGLSITNTSKAVSYFAKAGLLVVEIGFASDENGKLRKSRTIRLAMPDPFPVDVSIDLPHRHLNRNQVGARSQVELSKSSWPRVSDDGTRGQISDDSSSDRSRKSSTTGNGSLDDARSSQLEISPFDEAHDVTARPKRAFVKSPSIISGTEED